MRTGNIMEAMEAAKNGARVRLLMGDVMTDWLVFDEHARTLVTVRKIDRHRSGLLDADILGTWEIDDQPRRWPSIVEAVKHMEATGDWGRPVDNCAWFQVSNYRLRGVCYGVELAAVPKNIISEWETKPAEGK